LTATQNQFTIDEITQLTRRRRELAQIVEDYREDFNVAQNEVRQRAQALTDLSNPEAELEASAARERLRQVGIGWAEAEEEYKGFCAANPTEKELDTMFAERQQADEKAVRYEARSKFFVIHDELLGLLEAVQTKSAELKQVLNAAPPATFREAIIAGELCQPLNLWSQLKVREGSRIAEMRNLRCRL
jgi:hypothetical protein